MFNSSTIREDVLKYQHVDPRKVDKNAQLMKILKDASETDEPIYRRR
uniref:Uncharacterized protein n=1 Tax=Tetranychus urticae TaxID=32264 RepID=T1KWJ1_TETUR